MPFYLKSFSLILLLPFLIAARTLPGELQRELDSDEKKALSKGEIKRDQIGFYLIDIENGQVITALNDNKNFIPASVTKVLTTFFALKILGPRHRFRTQLYYDGVIKNHILEGNLYLKGEGDPFLMSSHLFNFIQHMSRLGIKEVKGKFIYDESFLFPHSKISDLGMGDQTYNPSIGALNSEFNRFSIWEEGSSRHTQLNQYIPLPNFPEVEVKKTTDRFTKGQNYRYDLNDPKKESWELTTSLRYRHIEEVPIRNPGLYTASLMRHQAELYGVKLPSPEKGQISKRKTLIHQHLSSSVLEITEWTIEYSNNLFAESLLLNAVRKLTNKALDLKSASKEMLKWFKKNYSAIDWNKVTLENGSGLTSYNEMSPKALGLFLKIIKTQYFDGRSFWSMLSLSGQSGWLKTRLNDPEMNSRIWGKTGSLDYVNNMAGYILTKKGKKLAYAIFINDRQKREIIDNRAENKYYSLILKANRWNQESSETIDSLLRYWTEKF